MWIDVYTIGTYVPFVCVTIDIEKNPGISPRNLVCDLTISFYPGTRCVRIHAKLGHLSRHYVCNITCKTQVFIEALGLFMHTFLGNDIVISRHEVCSSIC